MCHPHSVLLLTVVIALGATAPVLAEEGVAHHYSGRHKFENVDTNRDGAISVDEFRAAFADFPATAAEAAKIVRRVDKNGDGRLDPAEYEVYRAERRRRAAEAAAPARRSESGERRKAPAPHE